MGLDLLWYNIQRGKLLNFVYQMSILEKFAAEM